jgi:Ca-activated chloride channel family protein
LVKGNNQQRKRPFFLAIIICVLTIIALAGPTWNKKENPALKVNNPVILAMNVSSDMWAKDVTPSRGERSKFVAQDLLEVLKTSEIGLLIYSREPFVITPLTEDTGMVANLLPIVAPDIMPENGDRLDRAIGLAVERMKDAGYSSGNIVVLTSDVGERFDAALEAAADASQQGFAVNIIKMSEVPNDKLQMIADKGQGLLLDYKGNMQSLVNRINNNYANELQQSKNMQTVWEDFGYYIFCLPALFLLYYFRRGIILVWLVVLLVKPALAGWFLNNNQEAMQMFNNADYTDAAQKFEDEVWRGAAAYKSGNYQQALQDFTKQEGLDGLYNQGNALAKSGKIKEAMAKYEEVLAQDKNFEDARFNLEYLKKQQEQQQNQQNQQNQSQQNPKQQNQKQEQQQQQQQQQQDSAAKQQEQSQAQEQNGEQKDNQAQDSGSQNDKQDDQSEEQGQNQSPNEDNNKNDNSSSNQSKSSDRNDGEQNKPQSAPAMMSEQEGEQEAESAQIETGDETSPEEKEQMRARTQRFREIPEDKGGLVRAFIYKEYKKQRYKD